MLIRACAIKYVVPHLQDIFRKLTRILNSASVQHYQSKVEACGLLAVLAKELRDVADIVIGYYHRDVVSAIEKAARDRVTKVQQAATEARQEWKRLELVHGDLEKKKTTEGRQQRQQ